MRSGFLKGSVTQHNLSGFQSDRISARSLPTNIYTLKSNFGMRATDFVQTHLIRIAVDQSFKS
jgi:hypothetical protein